MDLKGSLYRAPPSPAFLYGASIDLSRCAGRQEARCIPYASILILEKDLEGTQSPYSKRAEPFASLLKRRSHEMFTEAVELSDTKFVHDVHFEADDVVMSLQPS